MTLSEIRSSIQNQLGQLTIDDIYTDPQLNCIRQSFIKLVNIPSVDQIRNYFIEEFFKTCAGNQCFNLQKLNDSLKNKISSVSPDLKKFQKNAAKLEREMPYYQKHIDEIPENKAKLESEIEEINKEIEKIVPPADDTPDVQLAELNKLKESKGYQIQNLINSTYYHRELEKMREKLETFNDKINEFETDIKNAEDQIAANLQASQAIKDTNPDRYETEYKTLVFLFRILQQKTLSRKKTGVYEEHENKYNEQKRSWDYITSFSADIFDYEITDIAKDKILTGLVDQVRSHNLIPDNWRELVYSMLSKTIPDISGNIGLPEDFMNSCFKRRTIQLTLSDTSALLALKIACQSNQSLNIVGNKIILALQGGVAATLLFREKGTMINSFQKQPFEIFANHLQMQKKYQSNEFYEPNSTTILKDKILVPEAYYILSGNYVLEIYFDLWPGIH